MNMMTFEAWVWSMDLMVEGKKLISKGGPYIHR